MLRVYPVTPAQRKRFLALLPSLQAELPGVRVVETSLPTEVTLWRARTTRTTGCGAAVDRHRDTGIALQLVAYPVEQGDAKSIQVVSRSSIQIPRSSPTPKVVA